MADEALQTLMIRLAKRLDKVEADMIELKAFVGMIKDKQEHEKIREDDEKILDEIKFNTLKDRLAEM
jgi:isopropylmalate/homocitrate/citramalate synthase